jgi:hypothetical protein
VHLHLQQAQQISIVRFDFSWSSSCHSSLLRDRLEQRLRMLASASLLHRTAHCLPYTPTFISQSPGVHSHSSTAPCVFDPVPVMCLGLCCKML